ncbi:MAG: DUF4132 domain-containing protein [Spirochaetales bacterium]|nr:DUF4132 domain-containing protein [Spirochaetales bacterium]
MEDKFLGIFGDKGKYQNKAGLDEKWIHFLKNEFREIEKYKKGITNDLLTYLLDDVDAGVLIQVKDIIQRNKTHASVLSHIYYTDKKKQDTGFYLKAHLSDPAFYYRLARVFVSLSPYPGQFSSSKNFGNTLQWVTVFLTFISYRIPGGNFDIKSRFFDFPMMEKMLEYVGEKPDLLMDEVFFSVTRYYYSTPNILICKLNGFRDRVSAYPDIVNKALDHKSVNIREHALQIFNNFKVEITPFLEKIVQAAVSSSKKVREAATALPLKEDKQTKGILERIIQQAGNAEKIQAVILYATYYQNNAARFLKEQAGLVSGGKLKDIITERLSILETISEQTNPPDFHLPGLKEIPVYQPLSEDAKKQFSTSIDLYNLEVNKIAQIMKKDTRYRYNPPACISDDSAKELQSFMENFIVKTKTYKPAPGNIYQPVLFQKLHQFLLLPEVTLAHTVRLYIALNGVVEVDREALNWFNRFQYLLKDHILDKGIDLYELSQVFKMIGLDPDIIGQSYLLQYLRWSSGPLFHLADDKIWPYFSDRLYLIEEAFGLLPEKKLSTEKYWRVNKKYNGLKALSTFPSIPLQFTGVLWQLAFEGTKELQPLAKQCVQKLPHCKKKIIEGLDSGKQDIRMNASLWLKEIECRESIINLKAALKKEKSDKVRAAFMEAMEALGVPAEEFIDRESLFDEAKKNMSKGVPDKLSWFAFKQLPVLKWKDTGQPVEPEIITWFIIRSYALKSPIPDPYLRLYCRNMNREDAYALGQFVLKSWLYQDTIPRYTHDEAVQLARQNANQMKAHAKKYPQYYENWDEQAYLKQKINHYKNECLGSAIAFKGLLAVTAACGNPESIKPAYDYIKYWYGQRAAQGKALIQMLAWIDDKNANQILLSIGRRFRTRGIQEEAENQINELAKRKGWTPDELADRTIPSAGLDENGQLVLDYGSRIFTAALDEHLDLILRNQENKIIKSLPQPNKADNEPLAKEAKKLFSASKKELKQVLVLQKDRLYEAFCVQKRWRFSDWNEYLNNHPIVTHYCQKLIWAVFENNRTVLLFRPLPDRSLTNVEDEEVTIDNDAEIGIIHDIHITEETKKRWQDHVHDYEVEPLFMQCGKDFYKLPEEKKNEKALSDFRGFLIESFTLRNVLTKAGYSRGQAQDGGWFFTYEKNFPALKLRAVISFSGNSLPEESRTVALDNLCFEIKIDESYGYSNQVYLKDIPGVLLSECYNDLVSAAKAGTGFDPRWEKIVGN